MSLDNFEVVDAIGTEIGTDTVVLSIMDSWDWSDQREHLAALQAKLNSYFGFVESGQIYDTYPQAARKSLRIDIVGRYSMPEAGLRFLEKASAVASRLNLTITHRMH